MIQLTILIPFPVSFSICSSITNLGLLSFFILYLFHRFLPCFNSSVYLHFSLKSLVLLLHERYHRPPPSKLLVSQEHTHKHKHDLPDDAWVEVLCRLSLKNMIRCKSVSKSWNILISHLCIPKIRPPSLHGLYFITCLKSKREITLTWDFACIDETMKNTNLFSPLSCFSNLPFRFFPTEVLHCSNGFLLIRDLFSDDLYVCNPLTKQLISLPNSPQVSSSASLMFDPHLSVVCISCGPLRMIIYSSITREWMEHRGLHLEEPILKAKWTSRHVSVDGCLYCLSCSGHLLEFDVKRVTCRAFELPKIVQQKYGSNAPLDCIGLSNGNLDYGWKDQDMSQIKVWTLHDGKWLPKHTISLLPFIIIFEGCDMLAPIAFHPTSDVLFLGHKNGIYGYHPDDQTLECFYEAKRGTYIDNYITFPFSWNVDTLQELVEPVTKNQS